MKEVSKRKKVKYTDLVEECCSWKKKKESDGQASDVVLTQTPSMASASLGGDISIKCSASQDINWGLAWYHMTPGQPPRLLIKQGDELYTNVPNRFTGKKSGTDFTMTITGVQAKDAGHYYCQQYNTFPYTVIKSHTKTSMNVTNYILCCRCVTAV
ncbi:KV12 protein, partial [Polypterus senegalus]